LPGAQYFLVENRQRTGFDSHLPGEGLLIYQVDENSPSNAGEWCPGDPTYPHYKVALEQADGQFQLEGCYGSPNRGNAGDPFPGSWDKRAFDDTTTPSSRNYDGNPTQVAVWDISDSDSTMYANMDVTWSRPCLYLVDTTFDDLSGGNGNGRPEGGETVTLYFSISNIWLPLNGTTVTGSVDTAGITFTDDYSYLGDIGTGETANNNSDPMEFEVDPDFPGRPTIFTLHVEGNTTFGTYAFDFEIEVWAGNAEILIVDDDSGSFADYQSYYTDALDSLRQIYDIWDTEGKGDPDFSFNKYTYLIWYTGDHKTDLFTQAQVESLMSLLDNGGRLFLTSQDAVEVLSHFTSPLDSIFLKDYLHVGYDGNTDKPLVAGYPGDEVGDTLWIKPWGIGGANNQTSKDILVPDSEADMVLAHAEINWTPSGLVAGTKFQDDYFKVVLFGFGFEALTTGSFGGKQLSEPHFVMRRVLNWLKTRPTINVTYPNGGEDLAIGDVCDIVWDYISFEDSVKIEYCWTNGGVDYCSTIVETTSCDGVYSWFIDPALIPSDSCLVIISDVANGIPGDTSDNFFSICAPVVNATYPDGGETLFIGNTYDILWECICFEDSVKIEYSTNPGGEWSTIVETTFCDGVYPWKVPEPSSDSCLVRISDVADGIPYDTSESYFSIKYACGDCNLDGMFNIADVVCKLNYIFGGVSLPCPSEVVDHNGDSVVNIADVVAELNYLFGGTPLECPLLE